MIVQPSNSLNLLRNKLLVINSGNKIYVIFFKDI